MQLHPLQLLRWLLPFFSFFLWLFLVSQRLRLGVINFHLAKEEGAPTTFWHFPCMLLQVNYVWQTQLQLQQQLQQQ